MKKRCFFVGALLVIGFSVVHAQTNQTLTIGQVFSANITENAVHTYRIQLGTDPIYYIRWEDLDNTSTQGYADIAVTVKHSDDAFYRGRINQQDKSGIRLISIKNPVFSGDLAFFPNSWYIIEVYGKSGGTYKIIFF